MFSHKFFSLLNIKKRERKNMLQFLRVKGDIFKCLVKYLFFVGLNKRKIIKIVSVSVIQLKSGCIHIIFHSQGVADELEMTSCNTVSKPVVIAK